MTGKLVIGFVGLVCVFAMVLTALAAGARTAREARSGPFAVHPIGTVLKDDARTTIRIDAKHKDGLAGLQGFSHVWVFYWFDRNDTPAKRKMLQVHPRGNRGLPLTGVFATRSPVRPNLIALTVCKIRAVKGNVIEIDKIDAFDGTPVIDLKPYIPGIDRVDTATLPDWVRKL